MLAAAAACALTAPLAAAAHPSGLHQAERKHSGHHTYVAPGLLAKANHHPGKKFRVIIQSSVSVRDAEEASQGGGQLHRRLRLVDAVAIEVTGKQLARLAKRPDLTITPDAPVAVQAVYSRQIWPYAAKLNPFWRQEGSSRLPTIAVVDSGIQANRADFDNGARVLADVNLSKLPNNSSGDGRGHGTFVAGIAAGSGAGAAGGAPQAKLVSLDVMDDSGMALTSDVIAAAQWIVQNKDKYNIRVANFSLASAAPSNFTTDPLDKAVEQLWFDGVVVVTAAGNYGVNGQSMRLKAAPGNDPFVITVGAADANGTVATGNDTIAPWSVFGRTYDGFRKPELSAIGRYMIGPVQPGSSLTVEHPDRMHGPDMIELSGTSFAAPVVSAAAADVLARHPDWTPDQVKGALMQTASRLPLDRAGAGGIGEVNAERAVKLESAPPNPNAGLDKFLVSDPSGGSLPVFDGDGWHQAVQTDPAWNAAAYDLSSWGSAAYDLAAYDLAAYDLAAYELAGYDMAAYELAAYELAAYELAAYELAAEGETTVSGGELLDPELLAQAETDPTAVGTDPPAATPDATAAAPDVAPALP